MEREIGRWNSATGITRPVVGEDKWVELWIGDVIECKVYFADRQGGYLHVAGTVLWSKEEGMYIIHGEYISGNKSYTNSFPLNKVVRDQITFIRKVPRLYGNQREIIFAIVDMMRAYHQEPNGETIEEAMETIVSEICTFGVVPKEEIMEVFERTR